MLNLNDIPQPKQPSQVGPDGLIHGPPILPQQRILLYSPSDWEDFTEEWMFYCLPKTYASVKRTSGAGDLGIDVAGFCDDKKLFGVWDNFQCKHYDAPLTPTDVWVEFGKVVYYTFLKYYTLPRKYYFVSPKGLGAKLSALTSNPAKLKAGLKENWTRYVEKEIRSGQAIPLGNELLAHLESLDFSIFDSKTGIQLTSDHKEHCSFHAMRFGGGLKPRPPADAPPSTIAPSESRYVTQLLQAYSEHKSEPGLDLTRLKVWPPIDEHFRRQREAFYHAESLREFARDTVPAGTFEAFQDDIFWGVVDTCTSEHVDGFARVKAVTKSARELQITSNLLLGCIKPIDRDGICHHLVNDSRLTWTESP